MTMDHINHHETFVPLRSAAYRLGIPRTWLRSEVEAGTIPHLRIGRRVLVNLQAVERTLLLRAVRAAEAPTSEGEPDA